MTGLETVDNLLVKQDTTILLVVICVMEIFIKFQGS